MLLVLDGYLLCIMLQAILGMLLSVSDHHSGWQIGTLAAVRRGHCQLILLRKAPYRALIHLRAGCRCLSKGCSSCSMCCQGGCVLFLDLEQTLIYLQPARAALIRNRKVEDTEILSMPHRGQGFPRTDWLVYTVLSCEACHEV